MAGGGLASYHIGVIDFLGDGFIDLRPPVRAMRLAITFQVIIIIIIIIIIIVKCIK
jgi:hypothetical protein